MEEFISSLNSVSLCGRECPHPSSLKGGWIGMHGDVASGGGYGVLVGGGGVICGGGSEDGRIGDCVLIFVVAGVLIVVAEVMIIF